MPFDLNSSITSDKKDLFLMVSQPALDVIAFSASGTNVTDVV